MPEPTSLLRAAATRLRDTAAPIAHYTTPWRSSPPQDGDQWLVGYATDNPLAGLVATTPDYGQMYLADWIALASPALAEPLADWLDETARQYEMPPCDDPTGVCNHCDYRPDVNAALAVARAVLSQEA